MNLLQRFVLCILVAIAMPLARSELYEGDSCTIKSQSGICKVGSQCPELEKAVIAGTLTTRDIVSCGLSTVEEIICCPTERNKVVTDNSKTPQDDDDDDRSNRRSTTSTRKTTIAPVTTRTSERPAIVACREIDDGLGNSLTQHILGGTPAELGEFPHMAVIGFRIIGNDREFDYRCGGTLIAKRFVLTAAHCVTSRDDQPAIVLLGMVNLTDPEERRNAEEIPIRQVHIHPEYSNSRTYNDIAILELEREVTYSDRVYPTCLYTDLEDPNQRSKLPLYVTGFGKISTTRNEVSNILLKAKLEIVPVSTCNTSYVNNGLNRRINEGIQLGQLCANDPGYTRDACQGDSGGPLNLVIDESLRKYRVVGVVSAGFSCGSAIPGLYARVAAYLDFIESIVWPN